MQIPDTIAVKQLSDVPAMVAAALQYAYGNRAIYFEGTLFEQGGRVMFSRDAVRRFCAGCRGSV